MTIFTHGVKKYFTPGRQWVNLLGCDNMEVEFDDDDLDRLETDAHFTAGHGAEVVRAYRKRIQQIRAFRDERDFYAVRSLNFEKLKGNREGQYSVRLNKQWRLILEFRGSHPCKVVGILEVVDYH